MKKDNPSRGFRLTLMCFGCFYVRAFFWHIKKTKLKTAFFLFNQELMKTCFKRLKWWCRKYAGPQVGEKMIRARLEAPDLLLMFHQFQMQICKHVSTEQNLCRVSLCCGTFLCWWLQSEAQGLDRMHALKMDASLFLRTDEPTNTQI